ncbi:MAG: thioredoxin domain-containing protein [Anaerolineales bacterium]|nr:thioredoxin domain-containing protein [Anaerolineales bacterium]
MPNRLADETSPYLLQHVENPVDWFPWGSEAFQAAQKQDKPIFLSIGYAACHWCHVMAHESFEDVNTATLMNEYFINVKVDREERPDVDTIYMEAVVAMTGQGGWPMSVFLTPEGKPFYGGTYFPPERRYNIPSFREVLEHIHSEWQSNRQRLISLGENLTDRISTKLDIPESADELNLQILDRAAENLLRAFDWENGGWGGSPKFPQSSAIEILLRRHNRYQDKLAIEMATLTLERMARGGIYDQAGGGFHRYSTDALWLTPHFEKMLYDNALLARVYLHAWQETNIPFFWHVVEGILGFLMREMRHSSGGFYASLDADSEGEEGIFYLWTPAEIREAVQDPARAKLALDAFGVTEEGNFEGVNILYLPTKLEAVAERIGLPEQELLEQLSKIKQELLKARSNRERPATDDKVLTSWNGLTLAVLAEAARVSGRAEYLSAAQQLADFLLTRLYVDGKLMRSWREGKAQHSAYLEDHAALGEGMLALYQVDFNNRWFRASVKCAEEILAHFSDPAGGFFDTRDDHEKLISRPKSIQDTPIPSGNSLAVSLLLKLAALNGDEHYAENASTALRNVVTTAERMPSSFAAWLNALDFALGPQLQLALIGEHADEKFQMLMQVSDQPYLPRMVRAGGQRHEEGAPALLSNRDPLDGSPTAFLCQGFACKLPTTDPDQLKKLISESGTPRG